MSTDDESFHPLGSEWEDELEEMLDDTEYDSELGMKMAQDAMRVTKGELSEAEFHEKYHEDVMEEFGEDNRPTAEAFEAAQEETKGTVGRMLDKFSGDGEDTRRGAMKKMGAGAAAVGLGAWGTAEGGDPEPNVAEAPEDGHSDGRHTEANQENDVQWGMAIDLEQCDGCLSCVSACASENNLDRGVNWMYVLEYEDPGTPNENSRNRLVRPCQHCTDAPCEKVCPTTARHTRDSDGLVLTDYDVCIGCRYCQVACPYGVNYFQWDEPDISADQIAQQAEENGSEGDHMHDERDRWVDSRAPRGVMSKCTMCPTRQDGFRGEDKVGTTACEDACPPDAIQFGDMKDDHSDPQQYAHNPSRGRTLSSVGSTASYVSESDIEEALADVDTDDAEAVLEALNEAGIDEEQFALMKSVEITAEEELGSGNGQLADYEQTIADTLDAIESNGVDHGGQDILVALDLADEPDEDEEFQGPNEDDAQALMERVHGAPESNFRLLEDVGTNPNIIYLGNEPGPEAEQTDPTGTGSEYQDVTYTRADGSEPNLVDKRQEVLDEGTVGDLEGVSL